MRIHVFSDLHLEFGPVDLPESDADVVVAAGDIRPKIGGLKWLKQAFPNQQVIYVPGNHEYYGESIPHLTDKPRRESQGSNVCVLQNEAVEVEDVCFLGCTLWTDFALFGESYEARVWAGDKINDYRRIRISTAQFRKLRTTDTLGFHAGSRSWLRTSLDGTRSSAKVVIVTHHAPSKISVAPEDKQDLLSAAFASNMDDLVVGSGAAVWIHGHTHGSSDYRLGQIRVVCNARGYPDSLNPTFDPGLVIDV